MKRLAIFLSILGIVLLGARPCTAQPGIGCERYYVMVFGCQQMPPDPNHSHSFAIFVKETCLPNQQRFLEHYTISWLAANKIVRVHALLPEPGANFGYHETMQWALGDCQRVSLWGPFEIQGDLYCRAVKQFHVLNGGKVRYKAVDTGYPTAWVSNCIHALGSVAGGYRVRVATPGWGETASYVITQRYRKWFINECQKHLWLVKELGLGTYPIIYRDLEPPRSGLGWTVLRRMLGLPLDTEWPLVLTPVVPHPVVPEGPPPFMPPAGAVPQE